MEKNSALRWPRIMSSVGPWPIVFPSRWKPTSNRSSGVRIAQHFWDEIANAKANDVQHQRREPQYHRWLEKRDDGQRDEPHGIQIVEPVEEAFHERAQGRGGSFAE